MGSCGSVLGTNKKKENVMRIEVKECKENGETVDCKSGKSTIARKGEKGTDNEEKEASGRNKGGTEGRRQTKLMQKKSLEIIDLEETDDFTNREQLHRESKSIAHSGACVENKKGRDGQDHKSSNLANDRPETSGHHRKTSFTAPLPSPSEWHRIYTKKLKHKEKLADEKLKKAPKKKPKNKFPSREERDRAYKVSLIKRIKKSILSSAESHGPRNTELYLNATGQYFSRVFGVNASDLESSTSSSSGSTSVESQNSSDVDLQGERNGGLYQGDMKTQRMPRKWFARRSNRVHPLQTVNVSFTQAVFRPRNTTKHILTLHELFEWGH